MPSPAFLVYEGDPANGVLPRRPTLADVGGGQKLNDENEPPDPITQLDARDFNQVSQLSAAIARVTPSALLLVGNNGVPRITALRAASFSLTDRPAATVGSVTTSGDFVLTKHGVGDIEIQCSADKLIPPDAGIAFVQASGDYQASARLNGTGDGIRIETWHVGSNTLADVDFLVMWE